MWKKREVKRIDFVFHFGGYTPKRSSLANNIDKIFKSNLTGTRCLLESLPQPIKKIVYSSSVDVYSPLIQERTINELSPTGGSTLHGASKLFCEDLIRCFAVSHSVSYAVLRFGHTYGPGEEKYEKFIPQAIQKLLRKETPIIFGDGSTLRDFLYVEDVVKASMRAALNPSEKLGPVNIVRGNSVPIQNVLEILIDLTKYKGPVQYLNDRESGHSLQFDNSQMKKLLGEHEFVSLEEGLRREVEYFRSVENEL
ncbi:NAD-dependent epimerase/dehydratase family protein [Thermodesulfobacteriota bacterium]